MNNTNLKFIVIPSNAPSHSSVIDYHPERDGKVFSTLADIKVNKIDDGYSILYHSDDINKMSMDTLGNNIISLFMENVPNTIITFSIDYLYRIDEDNIVEYDNVDIKTIEKLLTLESKFTDVKEDCQFVYVKTKTMSNIIQSIINQYKDLDDEDNSDDDDEDEFEHSHVNDFFKSIGISVDDENDEEEVDIIGRKNKPSKNYGQSKILKDSKNAKRSYNRHGVIICNNKKAKKQDEKIIKEFLKEFIPGNSEWKKEFRHDILKRWMKMYSISKNDLKELEKAHNKAQKSKNNKNSIEKTLELTSRIFNKSIDTWNDPNR